MKGFSIGLIDACTTFYATPLLISVGLEPLIHQQHFHSSEASHSNISLICSSLQRFFLNLFFPHHTHADSSCGWGQVGEQSAIRSGCWIERYKMLCTCPITISRQL